MRIYFVILSWIVIAMYSCDRQGGEVHYIEGALHDEDHNHLEGSNALPHVEDECEDHQDHLSEAVFLAPVGSRKISDTEFVVSRAAKGQRLHEDGDCLNEHEDHDAEHEDHDEDHEDHDEDHEDHDEEHAH